MVVTKLGGRPQRSGVEGTVCSDDKRSELGGSSSVNQVDGFGSDAFRAKCVGGGGM